MNYDKERNPALVGSTLPNRIILRPEDFGRYFDNFKMVLGSNLLYNSAVYEGWLASSPS